MPDSGAFVQSGFWDPMYRILEGWGGSAAGAAALAVGWLLLVGFEVSGERRSAATQVGQALP